MWSVEMNGALQRVGTLAVVTALTGCGGSVAHPDGGVLDATTADAMDSGTPFTQDGGPTCIPSSCAQLGNVCGRQDDGCGHVLDCGCLLPREQCLNNVCVVSTDAGMGDSCAPFTCMQLGYDCGTAGDGCGGLLNCGLCTAPQYCGGGGYGKCGVGCLPKTCRDFGYNCGLNGDGCGATIDCGTCTALEYCGGGGYSKCGSTGLPPPDGGVGCAPWTCRSLGYNCGPAGDGCGGLLDCGTCDLPLHCGGYGAPGVCPLVGH